MTTLDQFKVIVAQRLEHNPATLYGRALTLAEVVDQSPVATNSIDLIEAVAGAMAELDIDDRLELPTVTLQDSVDDLMADIERQLAGIEG